MDDKEGTFMTESGVMLELQPVSKMALQSITLQSGILEILENATGEERSEREMIEEYFKDLSNQEKIEASAKLMGVLRFCLMFGVKTDPPDDVVEELKILGSAKTKNIARMNWLLSILKDDQEAGILAAAIQRM